jgi:hypothetical protein
MFSALEMLPMDILQVLPSAVTASRWMEKSADGCSNLTCNKNTVQQSQASAAADCSCLVQLM